MESVLVHLSWLSNILGKREIKALDVKCSNMERGCEWVGTVGTLHGETCGHM